MGSGNAGATNMVRNAGWLAGLLTLLLDASKGFLSGYLGGLAAGALGAQLEAELLNPTVGILICGFLCELGHMFPVFFGFKGGKGVSTVAGVLLACNWQVLALSLAVWLVFFFSTRIVSVGSLAAAVSVPVACLLFCTRYGSPYDTAIIAFFGIAMGGVAIFKHNENIKRLIKREEKRISFKKAK